MTALLGPPGSTPAPTRLTTARRTLAVSGTVAVGLGLVIGLVIELTGGGALGVDLWWSSLMSQTHTDAGETAARVLNVVGGGWFAAYALPVAVAVLLLALRRPWAALYFVAASLVSVIVVQGLKFAFDRARPEDMLVNSDVGSFPSGHVANAATIVVAVSILVGRRWVVVLGSIYVLLMILSRTYLHVHWLSDTVAGVLVGSGVALLVTFAFAARLDGERESRRTSPPADPTTR